MKKIVLALMSRDPSPIEIENPEKQLTITTRHVDTIPDVGKEFVTNEYESQVYRCVRFDLADRTSLSAVDGHEAVVFARFVRHRFNN